MAASKRKQSVRLVSALAEQDHSARRMLTARQAIRAYRAEGERHGDTSLVAAIDHLDSLAGTSAATEYERAWRRCEREQRGAS